MKIFVITGSSNSSRTALGGKGIVDLVTEVAPEGVQIFEFSSVGDQKKKVHKIAGLIKAVKDPVILVGKSLGGIIAHLVLKSIPPEVKRNIYTLLVDPHGWIVGDGKLGAYGTKRRPYLPKLSDGETRHIRVVYQRKNWPMGARYQLDGGKNIIQQNVIGNHYSIENPDSVSSIDTSFMLGNLIRIADKESPKNKERKP